MNSLAPDEQKQADALAKAVIGELSKGRSQQDIVKDLTKRGLDQDVAANYVSKMAYALEDYKRSPQGRSAMSSGYRGRMIRGGVICLIGIAVTVGSFFLAEEGGRYVLAWGAVIFGGFDFIAGLIGWLQNS